MQVENQTWTITVNRAEVRALKAGLAERMKALCGDADEETDIAWASLSQDLIRVLDRLDA